VVLQQLTGPLSLEAWRKRGLVRRTDGRRVPIEDFLQQHFLKNRSTPSGATWTSDVDATGLAAARLVSRTSRHREIWALVAPASRGEARIGPVRVTRVPDLPDMTVMFRADKRPGEAHAARPTKLLGRSVPAVFLAPGEEFSTEALVSARATTLSLSIGTDPDAPRRGRSRWAVEVQDRTGKWLGIGAGERERLGRDAFHDVALAWPDDAPVDDQARIRFRVEGDAGLFIGQPLLRGPANDMRPNLLLVSLDTLRSDHLGCYGYARPTSSFLDALAGSAVLFEDVVAVAPYTLPAHATMFTGRMPVRHGAVDEHHRLDTRAVDYLPEILASHGYATAAFTGGGMVSDEFGFSAGFDRYGTRDPITGAFFGRGAPGAGEEPATEVIDSIAAWIGSRADERWFVFLHSYIAHEYDAPEQDFELFDTHPELPAGRDTMERFRRGEWIEQGVTQGEIAHLRDRYDATIHFADRVLGRLLGQLEQGGLLENTVVVITSDHGEEFGEHGSLRHAVTLQRELLQVPLIVRAPDGEAGRRITRPISQADLAPTLLDLLGLPPMSDADGTSRAAWIRGGPLHGRHTPLYAHVDTRTSRRAALRVDSYKVIRGDVSDSVERPAPQAWRLYDRSRDPGETLDLSRRRPDLLAELQVQLAGLELQISRRALDARTTTLSPELREQLDELGY
jgi:arylsulfatase A-like enzyme